MTAERARPTSLRVTIVASAVLHVAVFGAIIYKTAASAAAMPPAYRVQLVAAPPGPREAGVVTEAPAPAVASPAPPALETKKTPVAKKGEKKAPKAAPTKMATPNPTKSAPAPSKSAPKAGGGPKGGTGADVANVNTAGIEFPFPAYLQNIVRQIAQQFEVPPGAQSLVSEVTFLIHRDGSVTGLRLTARSGAYVFDQSCLAAVEAAAKAGRFGPLPKEFNDDVLPVIFGFDPKRMK